MSEVALPERDSYVRPWLITITLALLVTLGFLLKPAPARNPSFPALVNEAAPANWFFVLRMPAVTSQYESGIDIMRVRYREWLDVLTKSGYRPILFSDVINAVKRGKGIPPKSVVLVFDPGYRSTYEIIAPILAERRWSAVWLSDESAMKSGHREFVTYHTARKMVGSGLWDVGLLKKDGTYVFNIGVQEKFFLGEKGKDAWAMTNGSSALNPLRDLRLLTRLNVNSDWTATDLLNRIEAEVPVEKPVALALGPVQNLRWGVTTDPSLPTEINLSMGDHSRGELISWFGTRGVDNCKLNVDGNLIAGKLTFRFRWDEVRGNGIAVSIAKDYILIEERENFVDRVVHRLNRSTGQSGFSAQLLLVGDRVGLNMDGNFVEVPHFKFAGEGRGLFQIYLNDRLRNVASVKKLKVIFEPLSQAAVAWPPVL